MVLQWYDCYTGMVTAVCNCEHRWCDCYRVVYSSMVTLVWIVTVSTWYSAGAAVVRCYTCQCLGLWSSSAYPVHLNKQLIQQGASRHLLALPLDHSDLMGAGGQQVECS
jgi:hypothetical protein